MIELIETSPDLKVQEAEYIRLLGYPQGWVLEGRALELAEWARNWYARHGTPWIHAHLAERLELKDESIVIDDHSFTCLPLQRRLEQAAANGVVLAAVCAGPELEQEAQNLWRAERPDEYFFLEIYGSAVVEHLTTLAGAHCCAWADQRQSAILPHYSPGYSNWDVGQQPRLLDLIQKSASHELPNRLSVFPTGMLRPKKSQLAVFGVTREVDRVQKLADLVACESCSLASCQYRRAPYLEPPAYTPGEVAAATKGVTSGIGSKQVPPVPDVAYSFSTKALDRWANDRLSLQRGADGSTEALFLFEGSTCMSMGRPLKFQYHVKLGPQDKSYPIQEQRCIPHPSDTGHTSMCEYITQGASWMKVVENEAPLRGQPLSDVLSWNRSTYGSNCHCEPASRERLWGLVLETIHYALVRQEESAAQDVVTSGRLP